MDVRPAQRAAVDVDRLIAPAELRSVDHAAIRRRNQRCRLGDAESAEHRVVRIEILVDSDVALVVVVFGDRIDRVIAGEDAIFRRGGKFLQQKTKLLSTQGNSGFSSEPQRYA